jgi:hypothetical protein
MDGDGFVNNSVPVIRDVLLCDHDCGSSPLLLLSLLLSIHADPRFLGTFFIIADLGIRSVRRL